MLLKLLIFAIVTVVVYRTIKSWLIRTINQNNDHVVNGPLSSKVDDVMIKDPLCGKYFAQRNGVTLTISQKVIHFCSPECRDRYMAQQSKHR